MLDIGVSELVDSSDTGDICPEGREAPVDGVSTRGVARNPLSDGHGPNSASLRVQPNTIDEMSRHPQDARGVARYPLSGGRRLSDTPLRVRVNMTGETPRYQDDTLGVSTPELVDGKVDVLSTKWSVSAKRRTRRKASWEKRKALVATSSDDASSVLSGKAPRGRSEQLYTLVDGVTGDVTGGIRLDGIPDLSELIELDEMSVAEFGEALKADDLAEVVVIRPEEELNSSSLVDEAVLEDTKKALNARSGSAILKDPKDPFYPLLKEYGDVVSKDPPMGLPPDRGVRHEIDLVPGTKYCVTRRWPLPKEQCDVIDAFFRAKHEAGMVRESKSPHSTPTFCVRKPNGKWRIVHAYNKLNAATIPVQTPIPRKDVLQNNMVGSTLYSALDLVDGYYQLLMRACDVPLTAVSTPSGMLWEWLVMPQGLSNAPATFNRLVTQLFRPHRAYAQTYFDDIFVHSRTEHGKSDVEINVEHLRAMFE